MTGEELRRGLEVANAELLEGKRQDDRYLNGAKSSRRDYAAPCRQKRCGVPVTVQLELASRADAGMEAAFAR